MVRTLDFMLSALGSPQQVSEQRHYLTYILLACLCVCFIILQPRTDIYLTIRGTSA